MQVSVWEKESFFNHKDVIIAGSGLAGLWCAWFLKKRRPKLSVTIVERGIIPTGASTRNAGFACFGSLTELLEDARKNGENNMLELVAMRYKGLQHIQQVFGKPAIDFDICGGYELFTEENTFSKQDLEQHIHQLNKLLRPILKKDTAFRMADKKIAAFGFDNVTHLVQNKLEGYLHSGKLCQALLQAVQAMGVQVLNATEITGYEKKGDAVILHTHPHLPLTCTQLLVCTNAFAKQLLPELDISPARGQILLTAPVEKLPFTGTFHFDEGFYYFRNLGNRILLGGARNMAFPEEATATMQTTDTIQLQLESFLSRYILPGKPFQVTDRWSGIMGMGTEKAPVLREVSPQVFCAVRLSGMGVALAPVIGEKMAKLMTGKK